MSFDAPLDYLVPDAEFRPDPVPYDGPHAIAASISESLFWPLSDSDVEHRLVERGWTLGWKGRVDTPYGLGPMMRQWLAPSGRSVLFIRDYGRTPGGEFRARLLTERLFWILGEAGVQVVLAAVHAGAADWRPAKERVQPGDLVIPWSFESKPWFTGLPGTRFESAMNNPEVVKTRTLPWPFFDRVVAERAGRHLAAIAEPLIEAGHLRRIWTPDQLRSVTVDMDHLGFETPYDVLHRMATSRMISETQPEQPPIVTLHGTTVNPVLAELMGIELLQYQVISNPAPGMVDSIAEVHDEHVYDAARAFRWLDVEIEFLDSYEVAPS